MFFLPKLDFSNMSSIMYSNCLIVLLSEILLVFIFYRKNIYMQLVFKRFIYFQASSKLKNFLTNILHKIYSLLTSNATGLNTSYFSESLSSYFATLPARCSSRRIRDGEMILSSL